MPCRSGWSAPPATLPGTIPNAAGRISTHFYAAASEQDATEVFEHYRTYLHPDANNGRGFVVDRAMFDTARRRDGALMIGTPEQLTEKDPRRPSRARHHPLHRPVRLGRTPGRARARVDRAPGDRDCARRARRRTRHPDLNHGPQGRPCARRTAWLVLRTMRSGHLNGRSAVRLRAR